MHRAWHPSPQQQVPESVCINDCLGGGACFNFFQQCLNRNWGVMVLNPNLKAVNKVPILHNSNHREHINYVFAKFLQGG